MRGKIAKKIRKEIRKTIEQEVKFKDFLNEAPLRIRIKFAIKILLRRL